MQRHFIMELLVIKGKHVDVWGVSEESSTREGREKVEKLVQFHPCLKEAYKLKNKLDE